MILATIVLPVLASQAIRRRRKAVGVDPRIGRSFAVFQRSYRPRSPHTTLITDNHGSRIIMDHQSPRAVRSLEQPLTRSRNSLCHQLVTARVRVDLVAVELRIGDDASDGTRNQ